MESSAFYELMEESPIIGAAKTIEELDRILTGDLKIVFLLFGSLLTIGEVVEKAKQTGKTVFVHLDLIEGLSSREVAVDFLAKNTHTDGILSTKPGLVRHAKSLGLLTIQRFFVLDSLALGSVMRQFPLEYADAVEILPGAMPKVIRKIAEISAAPIIAGGLIFDKEDVMTALGAGAVAVSSTNPAVWRL